MCRVALLIFALLGTWPPAHAGQDRDNNTAGGLNVSVDLAHRVVIPQILYFRLGSDTFGDIDLVEFNITPGGAGIGDNQTYSGATSVPIGDGTPITSANGTLTVEIMANVGTVTLSYDLSDPLGLSDGAGNYIAFDEIDVSSADAGAIPAPVLANAGAGGAISVPITGNLYGGLVIQQSTTWTVTYLNTQIPSGGTYSGRVTYTLSAP
mgnify:CR=1 FL=1